MREYYEMVHEEERDGFNIKLAVCPDDTPLDVCFDEDVTDLKQLAEDINSGKYVHFIARVSAHKAGVELATDYLGSCIYESVNQFVEYNDYYGDMVDTVIKEAKNKIQELSN